MAREDEDVQVAVIIARFDAHQEAMSAFRNEVRDGLDEVKDRLDKKVNGRLDEHARLLTAQAVTLAEVGGAVRSLNHEVFDRPKQHATAPDAADIRVPINAKTLTALFLALAGLLVAFLTVRAGG
jgi:hypothetical protein